MDLGMKKMVDKRRRRSKRSKIIKHSFESCYIRIFRFSLPIYFQLKCLLFIFLPVFLVQSQPLKMTRTIHSIHGISKLFHIEILSNRENTFSKNSLVVTYGHMCEDFLLHLQIPYLHHFC